MLVDRHEAVRTPAGEPADGRPRDARHRDDALVLDSMRGVLRSWGCFVVAAESGRAALASLNGDDRCPDLIISDYRMPGLTGLEFLSLLQREGYDVPLIMLTGYASIEHAVAAIKAGARRCRP